MSLHSKHVIADLEDWKPSITKYREQYAKERRMLERTRYSAMLPQTLEDSWDEIIKLKKRIEQLEKQVSNYGWERDARNGNIQGMW